MNLINFFRIKEQSNNQIQKNEKDTKELKLKMNKDDKGRIVSISKKSKASDNKVFTHRAIRPLVRLDLGVDSKRHFSSRDVNSTGHTRTTKPHHGRSFGT